MYKHQLNCVVPGKTHNMLEVVKYEEIGNRGHAADDNDNKSKEIVP